MNNDVVTKDPSAHLPQTTIEIKDTVKRIQEVMRHVMKDGTHYGTIPGTDKPTLFKPGSEKLLSTFHISVRPVVEDLSTKDEIRYRVGCRGVHMGTDILMGIGLGECSTGEEKYKWRAAVCDEEYDDTDDTKRRIKYGFSWGQQPGEKITKRTKQVMRDPSDLANTVLKMAKKRAEADLCLTVLACSDIFVQDMDDLPADLREQTQPAANPKAQTQPPQRSSSAAQTGLATQKQQNMLKVKLSQANVQDIALFEHFGIGGWGEFQFSDVNPAIDWIKEEGAKQ